MANKKLVLMDVGMFRVGMRLTASVFYLYKGTYVLLCKDVVLSDELMEKLWRVATTTDGVFIQEEHYASFWNESLRQRALETIGYEQAYQEIRRDYGKTLSKTVHFLDSMAVGGVANLPLAREIANDLVRDLIHQDDSLLLNCVNMISEADDYLYTHSMNVATLNGLIGKWMNLSHSEVSDLIRAGLLHDLGKVRVNQEVLNKPGALTAEEFEEVKRHPTLSHEMLLQAGESTPSVLEAVLHHHEKPNGTGYPDGVRKPHISLFASITAVSDVYDAMVSKRCYKSASTPFAVLSLFSTNRFSGLDIEIVNVFLKNIAFLLVGMHVKLSSGESGEVVYVSASDYANPVVKVGERVFSTSAECRCVEAQGIFPKPQG